MRVFFSEYLKDYNSYTFSYAPYCIFETAEELAEIYSAGFLPYTGDPRLKNHLYYMARSIRIPLENFTPGSENRRLMRKFEERHVEKQWIPIQDFDTSAQDFLRFCMNYCHRKFKEGAMTESRLRYILDSPFLTGIVSYKIDGVSAGYVFISHNEEIVHYWYCFYDLDQLENLPLGKYFMTDVIVEAKLRDFSYIYLGTCYGESALYKVRDFRGVEFFDGMEWRDDISTLKEWCKSDATDLPMDRFKMSAAGINNEEISFIHSKHLIS